MTYIDRRRPAKRDNVCEAISMLWRACRWLHSMEPIAITLAEIAEIPAGAANEKAA
jgi:hypothetical protein